MEPQTLQIDFTEIADSGEEVVVGRVEFVDGDRSATFTLRVSKDEAGAMFSALIPRKGGDSVWVICLDACWEDNQ